MAADPRSGQVTATLDATDAKRLGLELNIAISRSMNFEVRSVSRGGLAAAQGIRKGMWLQMAITATSLPIKGRSKVHLRKQMEYAPQPITLVLVPSTPAQNQVYLADADYTEWEMFQVNELAEKLMTFYQQYRPKYATKPKCLDKARKYVGKGGSLGLINRNLAKDKAYRGKTLESMRGRARSERRDLPVRPRMGHSVSHAPDISSPNLPGPPDDEVDEEEPVGRPVIIQTTSNVEQPGQARAPARPVRRRGRRTRKSAAPWKQKQVSADAGGEDDGASGGVAPLPYGMAKAQGLEIQEQWRSGAASSRPYGADESDVPRGAIDQAQAESALPKLDVMLPPGWDRGQDPANGRTFYINHMTQVTRWEMPQISQASDTWSTRKPIHMDYPRQGPPQPPLPRDGRQPEPLERQPVPSYRQAQRLPGPNSNEPAGAAQMAGRFGRITVEEVAPAAEAAAREGRDERPEIQEERPREDMGGHHSPHPKEGTAVNAIPVDLAVPAQLPPPEQYGVGDRVKVHCDNGHTYPATIMVVDYNNEFEYGVEYDQARGITIGSFGSDMTWHPTPMEVIMDCAVSLYERPSFGCKATTREMKQGETVCVINTGNRDMLQLQTRQWMQREQNGHQLLREQGAI